MNKRTVTVLNTIYDALFELLAEQTFEKITVMEICKQAKVNKMTFYKYHEDKYEALARAFDNKFSNEFYKEFGNPDVLFYRNDPKLEENTYKAFRFISLWCVKYEKQIRNLISTSNQLAYDVASNAMFNSYHSFLKNRLGRYVSQGILQHISGFIFGGFLSNIRLILNDLNITKNKEQILDENDKACRLLARELIRITKDLVEGNLE